MGTAKAKATSACMGTRTRARPKVLADFGLAAFVVDDKPLFSLCGTPEFMAPEVVHQNIGYGVAADLFSLGVLLCQLLTLRTPYGDKERRAERIFANVSSGRMTMRGSQHFRQQCSEPAVR